LSPILAFLGISVLGTWGLAAIGIIAGGIILLVDPGESESAVSGSTIPGITLIIFGLVNLVIMSGMVAPLLGMDPPLPVSKKKIVPESRLTRWVKSGHLLRDLPDGTPKEIRLKGQRILLVRRGDQVNALTALCSHARLPLGGFPGVMKAPPVRDDCIMCPFHGARFEVDSGRVVRQPFDSQFNQQHPFLGGMQSKIFKAISSPPAPKQVPKPSMNAEDIQTFPVRVENGEVVVALKER
jgi:nitrite reductase/ring-hydroxylating ferredoxin subunit